MTIASIIFLSIALFCFVVAAIPMTSEPVKRINFVAIGLAFATFAILLPRVA